MLTTRDLGMHQTGVLNRGWIAALPMASGSFLARLSDAWEVLCGRAHAVKEG